MHSYAVTPLSHKFYKGMTQANEKARFGKPSFIVRALTWAYSVVP